MVLPNFIGPSNTLPAITAAADRSVNVFEKFVAPGRGKGPTYLANAPGLSIFASLGGPGMSVDLFAQDGRCFAVAGDQFCEVFSSGSFTAYGTVATVSGVVPTIRSNGTAGHQLFITSGLNGYIFDTIANTLTLIADADFPQGEVQAGEFMDGYFLVLIRNSRRFQISALEDGTSWDALDVAERSEGSDDLVSMLRNHREIWFQGTRTGEVWYDNGDADFPFAPIQGVFIEQGASATAVLQRLGNTVMWVNQDEDGSGIVNVADGFTPTRVSTFAVESALQAAGPDNTRAWTYQEDGHWFYVLHMDGNDTTFVYDLTMSQALGRPTWHERGTWDETNQVWHPNRPISHCFVFGKHLVGDRITGTIYEQSVDIFTQDLAG